MAVPSAFEPACTVTRWGLRDDRAGGCPAPRITGSTAPAYACTSYRIALFAVFLLADWWVPRRIESKMMAAALIAPFAVVLAYLLNQRRSTTKSAAATAAATVVWVPGRHSHSAAVTSR